MDSRSFLCCLLLTSCAIEAEGILDQEISEQGGVSGYPNQDGGFGGQEIAGYGGLSQGGQLLGMNQEGNSRVGLRLVVVSKVVLELQVMNPVEVDKGEYPEVLDKVVNPKAEVDKGESPEVLDKVVSPKAEVDKGEYPEVLDKVVNPKAEVDKGESPEVLDKVELIFLEVEILGNPIVRINYEMI